MKMDKKSLSLNQKTDLNKKSGKLWIEKNIKIF